MKRVHGVLITAICIIVGTIITCSKFPDIVVPQVKFKPTITTALPESRSIKEGQSVTFTIAVKGSDTISYTWYKDSKLISDSISNTITISNVQLIHAGVYSVKVKNPYGEDSSVVRLTVDTLFYSIQVSHSGKGTISPIGTNGVLMIRQSALQLFTYFPDSGSFVDSVIVGGSNIPSLTKQSQYTYGPTNSDGSFRVVFSTAKCTLNIEPTVNGKIQVSPMGQTVFAFGDTITFSALADSGYYFGGWGNDVSGTNPTTNIIIKSNTKVSALFADNNKLSLSVTSVNGKVTLTPPGGIYNIGTSVILRAIPDTGYLFIGWTDSAQGLSDTTTVIMNSRKSVTAKFSKIKYTLTVFSTTGGTITSPAISPLAIDFGQIYSITAVPIPGYLFTCWTVDSGSAIIEDSTKSTTSIQLKSGNAKIKALFTKNSSTLKLQSQNVSDTLFPYPSAVVPFGITTQISIKPAAGTHFEKWVIVNGTLTIEDNLSSITSVTITNGDSAIILAVTAPDAIPAPQPQAQNLSTNRNTPLTITLTSQITSGRTVSSWVIDTPTTHGTITVPNPSVQNVLIYTPTNNFIGTDYFTFKVSDGSLTSTYSAKVTIRVDTNTTAPKISQPLTPRTLRKGDTLTLTIGVNADAFPAPIYLWYKDGILLDSTKINTWKKGPLALTDSGNYSVKVMNAAGKDSSVAKLTLNNTPAILTRLDNAITVISGSTTALSIAINADAIPTPTYKWYFNNTEIPDANLNSYSKTWSPSDSGTFKVVVSNAVGKDSSFSKLNVRVGSSGLTYLVNPAVYYKGTAILQNTAYLLTGTADSFTITPALPLGLTFNNMTGAISGTPAESSPATIYTVTAKNPAGSATAELNITVFGAPANFSYTTAPAIYWRGVLIDTNKVTIAGPVDNFTVTPGLPPGLTINSKTGSITGIPTVAWNTADYTVTASNPAGSTTCNLNITVNGAATGLSYSVNPANYWVGVAIDTNKVLASGSVDSFTVTPTLPLGLQLNRATGAIYGTPTTPTTENDYTITAKNRAGSATAVLRMTVNGAPSDFSYQTTIYTYWQGVAIDTSKALITGIVDNFTVNPSLPSGLSINRTTGAITGTPTTVVSSATFTITARNTAGSTTTTLQITINGAPAGLSYSATQPVYWRTVAIEPNLATVTGVVTNYIVLPALPAGLTLNSSSGAISGTPSAAATVTNYTITARNPAGSTTAVIQLTVNSAPSGLSYSIGPTVTYWTGTPISANEPSYNGIVDTFRVSPTLPAGLTINQTTGVITGTPTTAVSSQDYTITAKNRAGTTTFALNITVNGPSSAPTLLSPADLTSGLPTSLSLSWNPANGVSVSKYYVQGSTTSTFNNIVINDSTDNGSTTSMVISNLTKGTTYHWRVRARNAGGLSTWSASRQFTIIKEFTLISNVNPLGAGTISPSSITADSGTTVLITANPNPGYNFTSWTGDAIGATNQTNVFLNSNKNITGNFTLQTFSITSSAGPNGTISPAGVRTISYGGSQSYTISPLSGYQITNVLVDGVAVGPVSSYTFPNVTRSHTIVTAFGISSYSITYNNSRGVSNPSNPSSYTINDAVIFSNLNREGSIFLNWTLNGNIVTQLPTGTTGNIVLTANWASENTITFDGQGAPNPPSITVAQPGTLLPTISLSYCTFNGWWTLPSGAGDQITATTQIQSPITVYAKWTITDINGNVYNIVKIGNQLWTKENYRAISLNDGTQIYHRPNARWDSNFNDSLSYCFYNNTTDANQQRTWGALYNDTVLKTEKLAPAGWRVPTQTDWQTLQTTWSSLDTASFIQSIASNSDWASSTNASTPGYRLTANNRSNFNAFPTGTRGPTSSTGYTQFAYFYFYPFSLIPMPNASRNAFRIWNMSPSFTSVFQPVGSGNSVRLIRN
jgi:uncharacterized protein (TIGR02145 family)